MDEADHKMYGDAAERSGEGCYICGHKRDHDGHPHGVITRKQFDMIRARTELDTLVMLRDNPSVQRTLDIRIVRLQRAVETLEQENHQ